MTERLITLPIAKVRIHPDNPRIAAAADDELVESIRVHGLIDPPLCAPDPEDADGGLLLDGHRRFDGAQRAGLTEILVRLRDDLVTTAQQVEVMAITGLQKELLSPVEEARAYEQLQLLGMDEATIAKSTGFTKKRVHQRLRLTGLTQTAQTAVHTGQATLGDVEAFHEFADDPTATAQLEEAVGTDDFRMTVNQLRARRARIARHAEVIAEFEEAGAKPVESLLDNSSLTRWDWRDTDLATPQGHDGCLAYVDYGPESYSEPRLVCNNPASHRSDETTPEDAEEVAAREAEQERLQAERAAEQERQKAASAARAEWLVEHFTGLLPAKGNAKLAESLRGVLPAAFADSRLDDLVTDRAADIVGAQRTEARDWQAQRTLVLDAALELTVAKSPALLAALGRLLGIWAAELLDQSFADDDELPTVLWLWDWLAGSGYPMSSVDTARHQELAARAAEPDESDAG